MRVTDQDIAKAADILRAGGLVAFPTETVYGLGADASNRSAVRRLFEVKGRPADHPVIVHIVGAQDLPRWAREVPVAARSLAAHFWPGPLTLVLRRAAGVPDEVTGGQDTVGLRAPAHPVAQALLEALGSGIAAPSANRFGRLSPTTAQHVREELGERVDLILDGGPCEVGIESTILDLSSDVPALLRPGHIAAEEIEAAMGAPIGRPGQAAPRAPGMLRAHYAPGLPMFVPLARDLDAVIRQQSARGPVAVLARHGRPSYSPAALWQMAPREPAEFAQLLYTNLRRLDLSGCASIVVEAPPDTPDWAAVRDRLMRAAAASQPLGGEFVPLQDTP
jgi:L-threonylcarbamoyladenylate synthase